MFWKINWRSVFAVFRAPRMTMFVRGESRSDLSNEGTISSLGLAGTEWWQYKVGKHCDLRHPHLATPQLLAPPTNRKCSIRKLQIGHKWNFVEILFRSWGTYNISFLKIEIKKKIGICRPCPPFKNVISIFYSQFNQTCTVLMECANWTIFSNVSTSLQKPLGPEDIKKKLKRKLMVIHTVHVLTCATRFHKTDVFLQCGKKELHAS